jgi:hypothetical protein
VLAGGAILGPAIARADQSGNINYDNIDKGDQAPAKYTIIDVVRPYEVGFIAVHVTNVVKDANGNDSFERLTGKKVHVRVISRYGSRKTAENDTNNDGVANIDIKVYPWRPLSVNAGLKYRGGRMALFNTNDLFSTEFYPSARYTFADMDDVINLHAGATYRLNSTVSLWLQAHNLLNRRYDILYGMGAQRIGFMVGAGFTF